MYGVCVLEAQLKATIADQLRENASRRDERANVELAASLARRQDAQAVADVFAQLADKKLTSDCIKVLYEIARLAPALVADYAERFLELLAHKNNRIIWGAMAALDAITALRVDWVYAQLDRLHAVADAGSVITRDHFVNILITLVPQKHDVFSLLAEQFASCPSNQLPMYAERAAAALRQSDAAEFVEILTSRLGELKTDAKRKRVEKVIKQLQRGRNNRL